MKIGRIIKNQKGFTAIEMVIVLAIVGILGTAAVMSITQVFRGSVFSNNHNTAINNVRTAGEWMSRDAAMANAALTLYEPTLFPLTLIWYDANTDPDLRYKHTTVYDLNGTDLIRTYTYTDTDNKTIENQVTTVAKHITSVAADFNTTNNVNVLTITISSPRDDKAFAETSDPFYLYTRTYQIHPRL